MPVLEPQYPVNLRIAGHRCLVVGGGRVALAKVQGLLECDAVVTVVAPEVDAELATLAEVDRITCERRVYRAGEVEGYRLVITATDDPDVNRAVFLDGEAVGVWVNSADDPDNCAFTLPAKVRQGPLLVTFATGGHSPALATWLRRRSTEEFGPEYVTLIEACLSSSSA
jgi:precorrin-2 dehydrogenase/sirohydrochlorin ferrochelatase